MEAFIRCFSKAKGYFRLRLYIKWIDSERTGVMIGSGIEVEWYKESANLERSQKNLTFFIPSCLINLPLDIFQLNII